MSADRDDDPSSSHRKTPSAGAAAAIRPAAANDPAYSLSVRTPTEETSDHTAVPPTTSAHPTRAATKNRVRNTHANASASAASAMKPGSTAGTYRRAQNISCGEFREA